MPTAIPCGQAEVRDELQGMQAMHLIMQFNAVRRMCAM